IGKTKSISFLLAIALLLQGVPCSIALGKAETRTANVRFELSGDKIIVHYDLIAPPGDMCTVSVLLKKESDPLFSYSPKATTGDVGQGVAAGVAKKIAWDIKKEYPHGLTGTDYYFVVIAEGLSSGSNLLLWAGAGVAAVAGGIAAILLLSKQDEEPTVSGGFPRPPGRP
ncbi:MAG TPA: hypothetical protein VGR15_03780, partial [Bacteroidota bacterium]|nr:hypothetical protein [Bacteroidota bacterium]